MECSDIVIVIPVYKLVPDPAEEYSLKCLISHLDHKYDIVFVRPDSKTFDLESYYKLMANWNGNVYEKHFDTNYFKSTETYSDLCRSYEFYIGFMKYKYMLIYQLDCILNFDSILDFAEAGYDYIGAPIVGTGSGWRNIPCVGNGGFSLRKIVTFCYITDPNGEFLKEFGDDIKEAEINNNDYSKFEDLYFAELIPDLWTEFTKPNYKIAGLFAWDRNVELMSTLFTNTIPMAFHAYDKSINSVSKIVEIPENIIKYCNEKGKH